MTFPSATDLWSVSQRLGDEIAFKSFHLAKPSAMSGATIWRQASRSSKISPWGWPASSSNDCRRKLKNACQRWAMLLRYCLSPQRSLDNQLWWVRSPKDVDKMVLLAFHYLVLRTTWARLVSWRQAWRPRPIRTGGHSALGKSLKNTLSRSLPGIPFARCLRWMKDYLYLKWKSETCRCHEKGLLFK